MVEKKKLRLGILASGRGSNFLAIQENIAAGKLDAEAVIVICNKPNAAVLEKAAKCGIPTVVIEPKDYSDRAGYETAIVQNLQEKGAELVVLAGYMRLVGEKLLEAYPNKVVNIHPALLPNFPGLHAQKQAVDYGVRFSGCTVHFVDSGMDSGPIISQIAVPVYGDDDEDSLSDRILEQEHILYSRCIQWIAEGRVTVENNHVKIEGERELR